MSKTKRSCWAACLGDCDGKISGEHVVSEGVLKGLTRGVGFSTLKGSHAMGINGWQVRFLCQHHNTALSPLDSEAKRFFRAIDSQVGHTRASARDQGGGPLRIVEVDGPLLERWFTKTFLNMAMWEIGIHRHDWASFPLAPERIVAHVFDGASLPENHGLYLLGPQGSNTHQRNAFAYLKPAIHYVNARIHRSKTQKWSDQMRVPMFFHIKSWLLHFGLIANITVLSQVDYDSLLKAVTNITPLFATPLWHPHGLQVAGVEPSLGPPDTLELHIRWPGGPWERQST